MAGRLSIARATPRKSASKYKQDSFHLARAYKEICLQLWELEKRADLACTLRRKPQEHRGWIRVWTMNKLEVATVNSLFIRFPWLSMKCLINN